MKYKVIKKHSELPPIGEYDFSYNGYGGIGCYSKSNDCHYNILTEKFNNFFVKERYITNSPGTDLN